MMRGAERAKSPDSASKSTRHSTSQKLQWNNSVPFMVHCNSHRPSEMTKELELRFQQLQMLLQLSTLKKARDSYRRKKVYTTTPIETAITSAQTR